jgi:hypothetical protein
MGVLTSIGPSLFSSYELGRELQRHRVITGYNTDVQYDGVVYHVQTEDKGLRTPLILSLVYVGGEILAAKRAPYDDLIAGGFDEKILVQRLERQHKLICAAVHAGRIEDLKRMSGRDAAPNAAPAASESSQPEALPAPTDPASVSEEPPVAPEVSINEYLFEGPLGVFLVDEPVFCGGSSVRLQILVMRTTPDGRGPAANVKVVVKTLSTAFSPGKAETSTDGRGLATVSLKFPSFRSGRAAVLIQAELEGARVELRRIILPGN